MEIFGTSFAVALGSWRLKLGITLEDTDAPPAPVAAGRPARRAPVPADRDVRDRAGVWKT
ncbi:MAG: hypothetical protein ACLQPV_09645 [Vulcanimicrobiaceae bacterium]